MVARFKRVMALVLATSLITMSLPANAVADINTLPDTPVVSSTNPRDIGNFDVTWRAGWGNDPLALFTFNVPQPDDDQPAIIIARYALSRPGGLVWPPVNPEDPAYNSVGVTRSTWDLPVDMIGAVTNPGPFFGPNTPPPGAARPYEGPFELGWLYSAMGVPMASPGLIRFGLDMTPPAKVTQAMAIPVIPSDMPVAGVLTQSRVHFKWEDKLYDTLAGVGYFELFIDGEPYLLEPDSKVSRRVYDLKEHFPGLGTPIATPRMMTVEDLPAGKHTFQIRAVDRATNEGPLSDPIELTVDPDIPDITIDWPSVNGQVVGAKPTFIATVKDLGGVASVQFYVDGVLRATDTASPYQATVDLSAFASGSSHSLKVVARDIGGRTNEAVKTFVIDKTAPRLSIVSVGSNPFYPRLRDGYRDNYTVRFRSSEPATATLTIKNSKGKTIRTLSKKVPAGTSRIIWNGKDSGGAVRSGSYRWYLTLTDTPGNRSVTRSGRTAIRTYQIKRLSSGSVRIIQR